MSPGCGQSFGHFLEHVDSGRPDAKLEVNVEVQVVPVDAESVLFSLTDHFTQGQDVVAVKVPLVVGVVLKHFEAFVDSVLNATQAITINY
jgi:hypothetical protein